MAKNDIPEAVLRCAKKSGYVSAEYYGEYPGTKVYAPISAHEDGPVCPTGLPTFIRYQHREAIFVDGLDSFDEMKRCDNAEKLRDKVLGSMVGGAVGDALGYAVEFDSYHTICNRYGDKGITRYELAPNGKALISDDTQMTLFTANGILIGETRGCCRGIGGPHASYCNHTYNDWLTTQTQPFKLNREWQKSWLLDIPELYARRAPGNTCLSAIEAWGNHEEVQNNSCGCGGVMRIAPIPLFFGCRGYKWMGRYDIALQAAAAAEITHKHPLGYIPAALLSLVITDILTEDIQTAEQLRDEVMLLKSDLARLCPKGPETPSYDALCHIDCRKMEMLLDKAIELSTSEKTDQQCIARLGEGWTGHEALAIALFCVMRHPDSFEDAVVAAVNHDGDSDSTGAICGNIMGALLGRKAIPDYYTDDLELIDIIEEMAGDLYDGCPIGEYVPTENYKQLRWENLYCDGHRYGDHEFYKARFDVIEKSRKNRSEE